MPVSEADYNFISQLLYQRLGIRLEKGKEYLVESRLAPLTGKFKSKDVAEFIHLLKNNPSQDLMDHALDAMTTNETYFFRDVAPFEALKEKVFPALIGKRRAVKVLNIWSAACSTGQEPYSIAITLREHFPFLADWSIRIFATDVASNMLARAKEGLFNLSETNRGIAPELLPKYFTKQGDAWKVKSSLAKMIDFRNLNLSQAWPHLPKMDLRNVLIYMDDSHRKDVFAKTHALLQPDGFLFLGAAETTFNMTYLFRREEWERAGCFRPI
jgi:chemotaxis protein methyltransferase CheR